jgi:thiol-disulfide isomerase/thioredoxin
MRAVIRRPWRAWLQAIVAWFLWLTLANFSLANLALANSAVASSASAISSKEVPIGGTLREATLKGLNGPSRRLSAFRGKPLIINVWASWCGPCREEMASLERLAWRDGKQYFAIIGISTDDYVDKAEALLKHANATISHFIDTQLQMENMLGASRLPLTVLVDAEGRVLAKVYGARQWDEEDELRFIDQTFRK